ncbi:hypothetical protein KA107_01390 [Candidatus Pacearchaeota archaeon]|nr:hypothetical protein [Candidatus Pacearchaeota archaeon]
MSEDYKTKFLRERGEEKVLGTMVNYQERLSRYPKSGASVHNIGNYRSLLEWGEETIRKQYTSGPSFNSLAKISREDFDLFLDILKGVEELMETLDAETIAIARATWGRDEGQTCKT